jgi:hypothetical protein
MIRTMKIYPPIGVARLGKSADGYFIGPERPLDSTPPAGAFLKTDVPRASRSDKK